MSDYYAEVIPNVDLPLGNTTFSYHIPQQLKPKIRVGQWVEITFARRKTFAVVSKITTTKPQLKKISPIRSLLNQHFILPPIFLSLAQFLARRYLVSLSKALFCQIPPTTPTKIKKLPALHPHQLPKRSGRIEVILGSYSRRVGLYIKQLSRIKGSSLVLLPNKFQAQSFYQLAQRTFGASRVISLIDLPTHRRFTRWAETLVSQQKIIVGTRGALFVFPQDLKLIIVDQPESFGFYSEQAPTFSVLPVSLEISRQLGVKLVIGEIVPGSQLYKEISQRKIPLKIEKIQKPNLLYVLPVNRPILNPVITTIIQQELRAKRKVLIYSNQAGFYKLFCQDCQEYLACPRCQRHFQVVADRLVCPYCKHSQPIEQCPVCQGVRLKKQAFGLNWIWQKIKSEFPQAKIAVVTSKTPLTLKEYQQKEIFLATSAIFANFFYSFGIAVFLDLDFFLARPNPQALEGLLKSFWQVKDLGAHRIIVETQNPEHPLFVATRNFQNTLQFITILVIKLRQAQLPPFTHLVTLKCAPREFPKLQKAIAERGEASVDESQHQIKILASDLEKLAQFLQKIKISSLRIGVDLP